MRRRTSRSSAAATRVCGRRSRCASASPSCASRCSRPRSAARAERAQRRLRPRLLGGARVAAPCSATRTRSAGARGRGDRAGRPRLFASSAGEDVWLREAGMLEVSAAPAQDAAVDHAVAAAARVGREDQAVPLTPTRSRAGFARRSSAAASSSPTARPSIRDCSCARCGGRRSTRASRCTSGRRHARARRLAERARDAGGTSARRRSCLRRTLR